ncbi:MAG: hypothetical protein PHQ52_08075 [Candidatus Omnitrophica bacterium]|nr:hypothetical protein [Candidatus Omnitrophota bacterium]
MKKYVQPKIKAMELSPEQAILNVCQVGGGYMSGPPTNTSGYCMSAGSVAACRVVVRGGTKLAGPGGTTPDSAPS